MVFKKSKQQPKLFTYTNALWLLYVSAAENKRARAREMMNARKRGFVVLFAHHENDRPRLLLWFIYLVENFVYDFRYDVFI